MDFRKFSTGKNDISRRLDKVIRLFASNLSLAEIYKGIRKGLIKVNNKKTKSDYRIQENDVISIASFLFDDGNDKKEISHTNILNLKMPEIIFENHDILIINKPYNVNVHGDEDSLDKIIENYYQNKKSDNSLSFRPGPLHRLDRNTTGLLAFSMSLEGARWFSDNIQTHKIKKIYYGLVEGKLNSEENWSDLILKNEKQDSSFHTVTARTVEKKSQLDVLQNNEKLAETKATPVAWGKLDGHLVTLVKYSIKTGRKHQIRAQSSLHHHPLVGDTAYGGKKINYGNQDFYLIAKELLIPKDNPLDLPQRLSVPFSDSFKQILKYCGIEKIDV